MQKTFYDKLAKPFEESPMKREWLILTDKMVTLGFYAVYPIVLVILIALGDERVLRVFLVPAISFVLVTVFRRICNARRPYEVWDVPPVIPKRTKGNSFPSRHVFSTFMIAMAVGYVCWPAAAILMVVGVFLAVLRVAGRVHFVRDVAAGALIAVALGVIGFWAI